MIDNGANSGQRTRELEIALFEKIDARLNKMEEAITDVRERVIRIEAQDVSSRLTSLELRVRTLEDWRAKVMGQVAMVVIPISATVGVVIKLLVDIASKGHP